MATDKAGLTTLSNNTFVTGGPGISAVDHRAYNTEAIDSFLNTTESASQQVSGELDLQGNHLRSCPNQVQWELIMEAESAAAMQGPSTLDTAHQIEFGPAQAFPEFSLAADGTITINQAGNYSALLNLNAAVLAAGPGEARMYFRGLLNGAQVEGSRVVQMKDDSVRLDVEFDSHFFLPAGGLVTVEMIRDSAGGTNKGCLNRLSPAAPGWLDSPCARIRMFKVSIADEVA